MPLTLEELKFFGKIYARILWRRARGDFVPAYFE